MTYRRTDAHEITAYSPAYMDGLRFHDAASGSERLRKKTAAIAPSDHPVRKLTFEEQLALVQSGKARIAPVQHIRPQSIEGGAGSSAAACVEAA